jgi:hypothetical protein
MTSKKSVSEEDSIHSLRKRVEYLEHVQAFSLRVLQMAYRKHQLRDARVGWDELGNRLCDAISNIIGGNEFAEWCEEAYQEIRKEKACEQT